MPEEQENQPEETTEEAQANTEVEEIDNDKTTEEEEGKDPSEQLQQWKQASRHHEREKKQTRLELKAAQEKLEELESASSEYLTKIEKLEEYQQKAEAAEARAARLEASLRYGLPIELVEKLTGSTPEELEESAKIVSEYAGKNPGNRLVIKTQGNTSEHKKANTLEERIAEALRTSKNE